MICTEITKNYILTSFCQPLPSKTKTTIRKNLQHPAQPKILEYLQADTRSPLEQSSERVANWLYPTKSQAIAANTAHHTLQQPRYSQVTLIKETSNMPFQNIYQTKGILCPNAISIAI
ncbi:hypothetical protein UIA24_21340 [Pseudomonas sp. AL 58]|uniref:hypothetical protein n=1 Tax=Pseudomonas sp. AL 58 TaxID=3104275 RepID=UPI002EB3BBAA|nr:hypothetical protein [Pseudomonas sp. AL 58]